MRHAYFVTQGARTPAVYAFCDTHCRDHWQMPSNVTACRSGMTDECERCAHCGRPLNTTTELES